jgi:hypothetical protein
VAGISYRLRDSRSSKIQENHTGNSRGIKRQVYHTGERQRGRKRQEYRLRDKEREADIKLRFRDSWSSWR